MYVADTIAAIATAPGPGAIGIVRVSGPDAARIAARVTAAACGADTWPSHKMVRADILDPGGRRIDDGLAVLMRAPHSYSGEDVLEIQCHGSPAALQEVLRSVLAAGARPAEPGEFTKRAFLNGKLDLAQAEAVMDLVRCRTPTAASVAADQLSGALSRHLGDLRERLIRLEGHLEVQIDFTEEDVEIDPGATAEQAELLYRDVAALLASYQRGRVYREGLRVAITGRPNVGKSSLLNALARANRAIVTAAPGTTRDVIEETIDIGGVPVVVSDTAGLRRATDEAEAIGIERARSACVGADLVLVVLDTSTPYAEPPHWPRGPDTGQRVVVVLNKSDLPDLWSPAEIASTDAGEVVIRISAKTGAGIEDLEEAIVGQGASDRADSTPPLTNTRQRDAIAKVAASLLQASDAAAAGAPPDIVAVDVQLALQHLGAVTGEIVSDDVLDLVFREFCMGK